MPPDKITITLEPITFEFSPIYEDGGFVRVPHYMEVMKAFRQEHKLFFFHKITPIIQLYLMMAIIRKHNTPCKKDTTTTVKKTGKYRWAKYIK